MIAFISISVFRFGNCLMYEDDGILQKKSVYIIASINIVILFFFVDKNSLIKLK